jgi:NAD(P)-dependent dehydrogenase (short-subunit alcohol dehydrogenase family)
MNTEKTSGTVVVTGGSRGIGAEIVKLCANAGYDVLFTYARNADRAAQVIEQCKGCPGRVRGVQADIKDAALAAEILEQARQHSEVAGLVNNVGITSPIKPFVEVDIDTVRNVFDVNVFGLMAMCQVFVRHWMDKGIPGSIVNVSSMAAFTGSPNEYVHYASSKAAVDTFTLGLAKECAPHGIRANVVSPGTTDTEIHIQSGEPGRAARVAPNIPMKRPGQPREIAEAVLWLLSEKASYVSGALLKVAGGL